MGRKRTIFIVPGFGQSPRNSAYKKLAKLCINAGFIPVPMTIQWKNRTMSENTDYFLKEYKKIRRQEKYILGFSYGAMIAFLAATKVQVSGLILCSLSPYFQEDLGSKTTRAKSILEKKRYADFSRLHSGRLSKQLKTKQVMMLYGVQEAKSLINRVSETFSQIPTTKKHLCAVKKAEHDLDNKSYLEKIKQATMRLL